MLVRLLYVSQPVGPITTTTTTLILEKSSAHNKKENITGDEVRDIIINFEDRNNMESKVEIVGDEIEEELKEDAKMVKNPDEE